MSENVVPPPSRAEFPEVLLPARTQARQNRYHRVETYTYTPPQRSRPPTQKGQVRHIGKVCIRDVAVSHKFLTACACIETL